MASQIDPQFPVLGEPTTESVRDNFRIANDEISFLQAEINAPDNRLFYARRGSNWEPAIFASSFTWSAVFNITGNEEVAATPPPQNIWLIPSDALPAIPFAWMIAGTGIGAFFISNNGLPIMASPLPGNRVVSLEDPVGSGTWYDIATLTSGTNLNQPNTLLRLAPIAAQGNRIWSYNPASAGIRFGIRYTGVGNNNGVPHTLILGLEGQILPIDLNVARD